MAGLPPVKILAPSIVRYTMRMLCNGNVECNNIVDIALDASGVISRDTIIDDFNSHVNGLWQDSILGLYADVTEFLGSKWMDLNDTAGRTGDLGPASGHPTHGSAAGNQVPPNTAYLVHKMSSPKRGQKNGRMFVGDVNENSVDSRGFLSSGVKSSINTATNAFRTDVSSYQYTGDVGAFPAAWRTVHVRKIDKLDPTTWVWSSSDITECVVDNLVASQRGRNR